MLVPPLIPASAGPHSATISPDQPEEAELSLLVNIALSAVLVLLGGIFAGLTLAFMGQDEMHLQVIRASGEPLERKDADKVLGVLQMGKHWVLVTLLLGNVITNEALPLVLDAGLGGGWPAVCFATLLIVVFGEVLPQSCAARFGLRIGARCAPLVVALMYVLYPLAYPASRLLDWLLGQDHGTVYKRAGLKSLVTLHTGLGQGRERLHKDEVAIISSVLDLRGKTAGSVLTPMEHVFTLSADTILDVDVVEEIVRRGHSRIAVHAPGEPTNFIGMLLVRILISYDPADELPVHAFPLAALPETRPTTSCLKMLSYFQEGLSHIVLVSEHPGEDHGALGVLTLEDVVEELLSREIVDESDLYLDIGHGIKRPRPGPLSGKNYAEYYERVRSQGSRGSISSRMSGDTFERRGSQALSPATQEGPQALQKPLIADPFSDPTFEPAAVPKAGYGTFTRPPVDSSHSYIKLKSPVIRPNRKIAESDFKPAVGREYKSEFPLLPEAAIGTENAIRELQASYFARTGTIGNTISTAIDSSVSGNSRNSQLERPQIRV